LVKYGIPVAADLVHKHEILAEAIWIVVGKDATGTEVTQGTAFSLSGVGIVSARHIFNNPCSNGYQVHTWELFKSSAPAKRFAVSAVLDHTALDLTIIESAAPHSISLERATTPPTARDPLVLVGYPQWNSLGDHLAAAPCYAIQLKTVSGVRFVLTTASLREGNSGGPMLDRNGHVIAVAVYDGSNVSTPNSGIDISHLTDLSGATARNLG